MKNFSIAVFLLSLPLCSGATPGYLSRTADTVHSYTDSSVDACPAQLPDASRRLAQAWSRQLPVLADDAAIARASRIAAVTNERTLLTVGEMVIVEGGAAGHGEVTVMRKATRLHDGAGGKLLGTELHPVGRIAFVGANSAVITKARQEIRVGDLLWPSPQPPSAASTHNAPVNPVTATLVSIASDNVYAAQHQLVGIDKGALDSVTEGSLLTVSARAQSATQASRKIGCMLILRVFGHVSYGVITHAIVPLQLGDMAHFMGGIE